jgi:hypothetical protein
MAGSGRAPTRDDQHRLRDRSAQWPVPDGLMTLNELLNSDLSTILALLRQGFDWWVGQLRDLVPQRLREDRIAPAMLVHVADDGGLVAPVAPVRHPIVVIPRAAALVREIAAPAMSRSDAHKMVSLDIDRYFPVPASELLTAVATPVVTATGLTIGAAAIGRAYGQTLANSLADAAVAPARILIGDRTTEPDTRFDLLPAMRDAGLVITARSPAPRLWAIVGFLVALNIGLSIWRDVAATAQMRDRVEAQAPAARIAATITQRLRHGEQVVAQAEARRRAGRALAVLDATSRALPLEAWVQRLTWQDGTLRLAGYRSASLNVAAALKRDPFFASVRNASGERLAATSNGQPFDLVVEVRR